ncbi:MAG: NAD(P)-dependent alcohol dehydrogenase [Planctomycetaceae bacterium]|nr:NAD(P)-dependent alcohol dehydrogenase [Planctomycetaceae bacterium]
MSNLQIFLKIKLCVIIVTIIMTLNTIYAQERHVSNSRDRINSKGMALMDSQGIFVPFEFDRHALGNNDVLIEILYSGICHSDVHQALQDWTENETYPMVPGHEIAGRIVKVGKNVKNFKVGDHAGVGCMVNSCGQCNNCKVHQEQYCLKGCVFTYASKDIYHDNEITKGGYSNNIVVSEKFVIKIPKHAPLEKVAPLLCAGITTYSPIKAAKIKKNDKVAVAGFGGLGHIALQYLVAKGAKVTVFDITDNKQNEAIKMGAEKYVNVKNQKEVEKLDNSFRIIFSTIPAKFDPVMYLKMLQLDGELVLIGAPPIKDTPTLAVTPFVFTGRRKVWGTLIGGIKETQEMLNYSVKNKIYPRIEIIEPSQISDAYKKIKNGEAQFRYVIDMNKLK